MRTPKHPIWTCLALAGCALLWSAVTPIPTSAEESATKAESKVEVEFLRDVVYGRVGDVELTLNIARPKGLKKPVPGVLTLHGGAWAAGRKEQVDPIVRLIAEEGMVGVTAQYRLGPRHPWPAQIEDVKCAVRWMRANAEKWNIDPDRIAAIGFSAGGHLALLLGTMDPKDGLEGTGGHAEHSSKVQAVISFFGPVDLDAKGTDARAQIQRQVLANVLGPKFAENPAAASPITYVDKKDAPILMFQGTRDPLVNHDQALDMLEKLNRVGRAAEVVFLVGQGHGPWREPYLTDTYNSSVRFIDRHFRPERIPAIKIRRR